MQKHFVRRHHVNKASKYDLEVRRMPRSRRGWMSERRQALSSTAYRFRGDLGGHNRMLQRKFMSSVKETGTSWTKYSSNILVRLSHFPRNATHPRPHVRKVQQEHRWKRSTGETKHGTPIAPQLCYQPCTPAYLPWMQTLSGIFPDREATVKHF